MGSVVDGRRGAVESAVPFFGSGLLHGLLLAWLAFGTVSRQTAEPRQNIYDMTIRGQQRRIIWYRLSEKLPEVRPAEKAEPAEQAPRRPLRAVKNFDQTLVAGPKDTARAPRMVWSRAPETVIVKPQPLPIVIAVEQKPLVKSFTAPVPRLVTPKPTTLPDAPQVSAALKPAEAGPQLKPLVKTFARPEQKPVAQTTPALADAPQVSAKLGPAEAGPQLKLLVKPFARPAQKTAEAAADAVAGAGGRCRPDARTAAGDRRARSGQGGRCSGTTAFGGRRLLRRSEIRAQGSTGGQQRSRTHRSRPERARGRARCAADSRPETGTALDEDAAGGSPCLPQPGWGARFAPRARFERARSDAGRPRHLQYRHSDAECH